MKKLLPILMSFVSVFALAQTPCNSGVAGIYLCSGYDLQSSFTLGELGASSGNDSWGWTDSLDGKEYALIGLSNGTAFIDISDPVSPVYLGKLPTHTSSSTWRDVKVYQDFAFVVSEAGGHGMQVFDLTRLRSVANAPETFTEDAHYNGFGSAHNIVINEDSGYAYGVGTNSFNGGAHFVNIQNPLNPVAAGGYSAGLYTHDAQIVTYNGPDTDYTGREIFIGSNEDRIVIADITDKANPVTISDISYTNVAYTHQGWFTEDERYFIVGDEIDELNVGGNTRTIVFDFNDLDAPVFHFEHFGETSAIDHNGYVVGDKYYMANYRAGMRVLDISDIANGNITEEGYFDTYTASNSAGFDGAWNVYPYFASGNIVISDIDSGFFLVKAPSLGVSESDQLGFSIYPNPSENNITIKSTNDPITIVEIYNVLGQRVLNLNFSERLSENINISSLNSGLYLVKINANTTRRLIVK
ncbi:MAG: choice-of-anchor B domain-containing protein [Ulvibacter sp.]|jgi:choice-of-anchor B domain-containing protein